MWKSASQAGLSWVRILALPPSHYVSLGKSLSLSRTPFLTCKMEMTIPALLGGLNVEPIDAHCSVPRHSFLLEVPTRPVLWLPAGSQGSTSPWYLVSLHFETVESYLGLTRSTRITRNEEALGWEVWSGVPGWAGSQQAWP